MSKLLVISLLIFATSCIKTAEQVEREKRLESIGEQMKDSQGLMTDVITQIKDMQGQLDKMNGRLEELEHRQKQVDPQNLSKMNEDMALLKSQSESQTTQLQAIQTELKEQRGFIEKVTASLGSLSSNTNNGTPKAKKKSVKAELSEALSLVSNGKWAEARNSLEPLIDHSELTPGDRNKVLNGLGKSEYNTKNYDKALVYFSKIYTKFPKASLAPESLLYIARSLKKMGKNDEAKEAFNKVLEDYPGSKEANKAKKEL